MKLSNCHFKRALHIIVFAFFISCTGFHPASCTAQVALDSKPVEVTLPSALPSGDPINDQIYFRFYPPPVAAGHPVPAVVLLHYLGASNTQGFDDYARYLGQRGIAAAVVTLPYHMQRLRRTDTPLPYFFGNSIDIVVHAYAQGVSDVRTVVTWLTQQPTVDPHRLAAVGISLGAIMVHLAMGQDERINAGVALLGGGDFPDIYRRSAIGRLFRTHPVKNLTPEMKARLSVVDPITYANRNRPRRVLMVQAARDSFIPPRDSEKLWKALGQPPIQWLDINHMGIALAASSAMPAATTYLLGVWNGSDLEGRHVPAIHAPTIKAGMLIGLDSIVSPAVTWQAFSLGRRPDHMSLFHADLGWSGRGPFVGLAATAHQFVDIGLGHRLRGNGFRPYTSLHIVF
ncbi:MAG: prolyl oligopeptidase family serine peptidase [Abitibacteriaceae bacterium]|nr:prolyl oligopeptidase family serine peptidase [Abditibacteriaceae bacterium]